MKYIVFDHVHMRTFFAPKSHVDEAACHPNEKPTSAGMIGWENGKLVCYGRSERLGIGSIPFDTTLLDCGIKEIRRDYAY